MSFACMFMFTCRSTLTAVAEVLWHVWAAKRYVCVCVCVCVQVILWNWRTQTQISTLNGHQAPVASVDMALDGSVMASGDKVRSMHCRHMRRHAYTSDTKHSSMHRSVMVSGNKVRRDKKVAHTEKAMYAHVMKSIAACMDRP